ncbi:DEAD/DEAH box helicase [Clostridium manihotivorum]|uniref:DNA 3'-5' helicase n=1 Tax=Clostridium manihotivorum TaxID=2320868 RepID=A0A3R5U6Z2_9CLOT|nr:DEAD/DEAH box helicase [Clostridium manihotivorum]QAA33543.1 hypothetical protein C1I91_18895 [Clostridium manihotivorum]
MVNIKNYIKNKIDKYLDEAGTIVVLKGIDVNIVENITVNLDDILNNKLNYFFKIAQSGRKIITYDEYLVLNELVLMQYKKIIIFENNIYFNYYPLQIKIESSKLNSLIIHYDEDIEGDKYEIGSISDLTSIYSNIKCINNNYYVTYNNIITDEKEQVVQLFEKDSNIIEIENIDDSSICYEIIDEEDFILFIDDILNERFSSIYILEKNAGLSKNILEEKIKVIRSICRQDISIKFGLQVDSKKRTEVKPEFLDILKIHWGDKNTFKPIKVYNINSLSRNEKIVEKISQSDIINDIVEQTEKCIQKEDFRDIFVTAPTGAGKSAMFQIPAIYLANKYELFTIVISPLIGLMKDQVLNLELKNYKYARTINSDISPIQKQEIINDIADKKCNILYISPESLLSKSDLEQIIGERTLGLLVIDEAHIVTTWGKQFRPDYWYLGDHLNKIKKSQFKKKGMGFVIATFTATAIYGGIENMYEETVQSLKLVDPITYLGFIKRDDINIKIEHADLINGKTEYELNKFDHLIEKIDYAMFENKKMLIYFPTVALINRFWEYCVFKNINKYVSRYHGKLASYEKEENYLKFLNNDTPIMLATKAFGMGIDIDDVDIVAHFSPTGNVCDYVQEIGRAARRPGLIGEAYYKFMKSDFKHINRLHGLSTVKDYQLIEVIRKVYELHQENIKNYKGNRITKKRNEMLVDAENFAHIFENPFFSEDDGINKVKTAMLLIQKDFERRYSFSPFHVRPIPLFEIGFFMIDNITQKNIRSQYGKVLEEVDKSKHICSVNLKKIWEHNFNAKYSFPKFKYMIYSKDPELEFDYKFNLKPALSITIDFQNNYLQNYEMYFKAIRTIVNRSMREEVYYAVDGEGGLVDELMKSLPINIYKAKSIIETILASMSVYQRDYSKNMHGKVFKVKVLKSGDYKYNFMSGTAGFFRWIDNSFKEICSNINEDTIYLIDENGNNGFREKLLILGVLETLDLLVFKALGGKNSQIYIYVNQTKTMKEILDKPWRYKNRLVELVGERHKISVEMLAYIFESKFTNSEIWDLIEDYFLGIIPDHVVKRYEKNTGKKLELV